MRSAPPCGRRLPEAHWRPVEQEPAESGWSLLPAVLIGVEVDARAAHVRTHGQFVTSGVHEGRQFARSEPIDTVSWWYCRSVAYIGPEITAAHVRVAFTCF